MEASVKELKKKAFIDYAGKVDLLNYNIKEML